MEGRPLFDALRTAHLDVDSQCRQVELAVASDVAEPLATLTRMTRALATAEEHVLFPALRQAMSPETILVDSCISEHQDLADRLDTLARSPQRAGFATAFAALAQDVREHQQDEVDTVLPVLTEALDEDGSTALAAEFKRVLDAP